MPALCLLKFQELGKDGRLSLQISGAGQRRPNETPSFDWATYLRPNFIVLAHASCKEEHAALQLRCAVWPHHHLTFSCGEPIFPPRPHPTFAYC